MSIFKRLFNKKDAQKKLSSPALEDMKSLPRHVRFATHDPQEIVEVLFGRFLPEIPTLTEAQFQTAYKRLRDTWGSLALVEGTEAEIKKVILHNARSFSQQSAYKYFTIPYIETDKGEEAVQMGVTVGEITWLVRVWKTDGRFHAFGRREFLLAKPEYQAR